MRVSRTLLGLGLAESDWGREIERGLIVFSLQTDLEG